MIDSYTEHMVLLKEGEETFLLTLTSLNMFSVGVKDSSDNLTSRRHHGNKCHSALLPCFFLHVYGCGDYVVDGLLRTLETRTQTLTQLI